MHLEKISTGTCIIFAITLITVVSVSSPYLVLKWPHNTEQQSQGEQIQLQSMQQNQQEGHQLKESFETDLVTKSLEQTTFLGYLQFLDQHDINIPDEQRRVSWYLKHRQGVKPLPDDSHQSTIG